RSSSQPEVALPAVEVPASALLEVKIGSAIIAVHGSPVLRSGQLPPSPPLFFESHVRQTASAKPTKTIAFKTVTVVMDSSCGRDAPDGYSRRVLTPCASRAWA